MAEIFLLVASIVATILMTATAVYTFALSFSVRKPGIGRVVFLSLVSLKFWNVTVLTYFLFNTFAPLFFGPVDADFRLWFRIFLVMYLLVQTLSVLTALERWRRGFEGNPVTWLMYRMRNIRKKKKNAVRN